MFDFQTVQQLALLQVAIDGGEDLAQEKYDHLHFVAVSEELEAAMIAATELDAADPESWHNPQANETYQGELFGGYAKEAERAEELRAQGDEIGLRGNTLALFTALMAITLFLLGTAVVVRRPKIQWILIGTGSAIFAVTAVQTALVPFVWL